jgi:cyanamide hydratase
MADADPVKAYGWTAMPRKVETLLASRTNVHVPAPVSVKDVALPDSPLAKAVLEYAKRELASETFNHSMRVYYYGMHSAMLSHLQEISISSPYHPPPPL